jgi:hypothetical protein
MRAAFSEICPILQSYTLSRNGSFTLGFENHEQLYQLIQEAREQHDLLKQEFEKQFQTVRAEVQLHITSEEGEIFPQVQRLTDKVSLSCLGAELESAKAAYENGSKSVNPVSPR